MKQPEQCRVCGAAEISRALDCRERMFGLDGHFTYTLCAACGSLSQSAQDFDMAKYYPPQYYSFAGGGNYSLKTKAACFVGRLLPPSLGAVAERFSYSLGQVARVRAEIADWLGSDRRAPRLLDVGCGSGSGSLRYHYAGCRVEGLDPYYHGKDPAEFIVHRMQLSELRGTYDVITFNHSLEHMASPRPVLENALRLLADDGACVIELPKLPSAAFEEFGEYWFSLDAPRHYFIPSERGMTELAQSVGFKRVRVADQRIDETFFWSEAYRRGKNRYGSQLDAILSGADFDLLRQQSAAAAARNASSHGAFVLNKN